MMPRVVELHSYNPPTTYNPTSRYSPNAGKSMSTVAVTNYPQNSSSYRYSESPSRPREHALRTSPRSSESYTPRSYNLTPSTSTRYSTPDHTSRSILPLPRPRESKRENNRESRSDSRISSHPDFGGLQPTKVKYVYKLPCSQSSRQSTRQPSFEPSRRSSPRKHQDVIVANYSGDYGVDVRPYGEVGARMYESRTESRERRGGWRAERVTVDYAYRW